MHKFSSVVKSTIEGAVDVDRPRGKGTIAIKIIIVEPRVDADKPHIKGTVVD